MNNFFSRDVYYRIEKMFSEEHLYFIKQSHFYLPKEFLQFTRAKLQKELLRRIQNWKDNSPEDLHLLLDTLIVVSNASKR